MSPHYIYEEKPDGSQLYQGDVLERTPELISLLKNYHPHYAEKEDYQYFLVITQSCDLHRRGVKPPKSRYISIAAVRPVQSAIWQEARKYQEWWQIPENIISEKYFEKIIHFTESLIDNNAPNYFYLHEDYSFGISEYNCAFLALSVALKVDHYDLCLKAKIAQLKNEFQAKLGWLVGDLYSRVGTIEWDSVNSTKVTQIRQELLKPMFQCVSKKRIDSCLQKLGGDKNLTDYSPEDIVKFISSDKPVKKSMQFSSCLKNVLNESLELGKPIKKNIINDLHSKIISDSSIKTILRQLD